MKTILDNDIAILNQRLILMGTIAENAISSAIDSFLNLNQDIAAKVINEDSKIDALEREIEEKAIKTLALRQPLAADLRYITATMKINIEIERMGNIAANVAQRTLEMTSQESSLYQKIEIPQLAIFTKKLVNDVFNLLAQKTEQEAYRVIEESQKATIIREELYKNQVSSDSQKQGLESTVISLRAARHLERICDHTKYIAEDILYILNGTKQKSI